MSTELQNQSKAMPRTAKLNPFTPTKKDCEAEDSESEKNQCLITSSLSKHETALTYSDF